MPLSIPKTRAVSAAAGSDSSGSTGGIFVERLARGLSDIGLPMPPPPHTDAAVSFCSSTAAQEDMELCARGVIHEEVAGYHCSLQSSSGTNISDGSFGKSEGHLDKILDSDDVGELAGRMKEVEDSRSAGIGTAVLAMGITVEQSHTMNSATVKELAAIERIEEYTAVSSCISLGVLQSQCGDASKPAESLLEECCRSLSRVRAARASRDDLYDRKEESEE